MELEFGVPAAEFERARERAFRELSRNARLPGFRPGKVPRKVFEANYGSEGIEERAREAILGDAYAKALEENALEPVERASLEQLESADGEDVRFKATFDVRPDIVLGEYKNLTGREPSVAPSEADVDDALEVLRKSEAVLVPVERPVALGDVPTLDYVGRIDGEAFEGGSAENQPTEMREGRFIPGFADGIVGMQSGETKDVTATFPADYANTDYAGKTAVFTITVRDVKVPELPALDDEFAARFSKNDAATLEGLRADVRTRLERTNRGRARQAAIADVLEKLREAHTFPLPQVLVEREIDALVDETKSDAEQAGVSWSEFLTRAEKSDEDVRNDARPDAERRVKTGLLLETIARAENITASERDVDGELASLSSQYGRSKAQILEMVRPNLPALVQGIVRSKTIDFLIDGGIRVEASRGPTA